MICSRSGGVFKKRFFYRHSKNRCVASPVTRPDPVAVPNVQDAKAARAPLWAKVLSDMDKDAIFEIVKADPTILRLGKNIYDERKPKKEKAARNKARPAMRQMARLLQLAKGVETLAALLDVSNFYLLQEAIIEMCVEGGKSKPGLKVALGSLIKKAAKGLVTDLYVANRPVEASQVEIFQKVFHTNYQQMFSVAEYQLKETRQRDNRKPAVLPNEGDLEKLRTFLNEDISTKGSLPTEQVTRQIYIRLRKVVLTHLTLPNAG